MSHASRKTPALPDTHARRFVMLHAIAILVACALGAAGCAFPRAGSPGFFEVTVGADAVDDDVGDGRCRSALPSGACTLRAAIQESNALADSTRCSLVEELIA